MPQTSGTETEFRMIFSILSSLFSILSGHADVQGAPPTVCSPTMETIITFWSYSDLYKVKRCFWELPINNVESLGPSSTLASPELARECPCRWASSP